MEKISKLYIHQTGKMYRYFRQGKQYLCKKLLLTLYYCFIYPHINYAILIWGSCAKLHLRSVIKIQKKAIRLIDLASPYTSTEPIFVKFSLLTVENIYNIGTFMYRFRNSLLPECFDQMFQVNTDVHKHNAPQSCYYHVPL